MKHRTPYIAPTGHKFQMGNGTEVYVFTPAGKVLFLIETAEPREVDVPAYFYDTAKRYAHEKS